MNFKVRLPEKRYLLQLFHFIAAISSSLLAPSLFDGGKKNSNDKSFAVNFIASLFTVFAGTLV